MGGKPTPATSRAAETLLHTVPDDQKIATIVASGLDIKRTLDAVAR